VLREAGHDVRDIGHAFSRYLFGVKRLILFASKGSQRVRTRRAPRRRKDGAGTHNDEHQRRDADAQDIRMTRPDYHAAERARRPDRQQAAHRQTGSHHQGALPEGGAQDTHRIRTKCDAKRKLYTPGCDIMRDDTK
jgi:hypothetical protein